MSFGAGIRAGRAFLEVGLRDLITRDLRGLVNRVTSQVANLGRIGLSFSLAGAAITEPFRRSVQFFTDIDDSIRRIAAQSNRSLQQIAPLADEIRRLGRETTFTTRQITDVGVALSRTNLSPQQIQSALLPVADLSRATFTETGRAADIVANALAQFRVDAEDTGRVVDLLTFTTNNSTQTLEDLANALSFIGNDAQNANSSLEDVLASLGILANLGRRGTIAGTDLRRVLAIFSTEEAQAALAEFDINLDDQNFANFADTLGVLGERTRELSRIDRSTLFQRIFGILGRSGSLTLSQNFELFDNFVSQLGDAGGTARRTSDLIDGGLGGSIRRLRSAIEGIQEAVGRVLDLPVRSIVEEFRLLITRITQFVERNPDAAQAVAAFGGTLVVAGLALTAFSAAIGGGLIVLSSFLAIVGSLVGVVGGAVAFFLTWPGAITAVTVAFGLLVAEITVGLDTIAGSGQRTFENFFGSFETSATEVRAAFQGIVNEIINQDWEGAGRIASTAFELQFYEMLARLRTAFQAFFAETGVESARFFNRVGTVFGRGAATNERNRLTLGGFIQFIGETFVGSEQPEIEVELKPQAETLFELIARLRRELNEQVEAAQQERTFRLQFEGLTVLANQFGREFRRALGIVFADFGTGQVDVIGQTVGLGIQQAILETSNPLAAALTQATQQALQQAPRTARQLVEDIQSSLSEPNRRLDVLGFAGTQNLLAGVVTSSTQSEILSTARQQLEEIQEQKNLQRDTNTLLKAIADNPGLTFD